jgi:general secretion pathway protein E/type IV pilus assembly protein PilB
VASSDDYLVENLVELGFVTQQQVDNAQMDADTTGDGLVDTLIKTQVLRPIDLAHAKAAYFGKEFVNLGELRLSDDVISAVPRHIAKKYRAVPVFAQEGEITVAISDPSDLETIDGLEQSLNAVVNINIATDEDIEESLNRYYESNDTGVAKMIQDITEGNIGEMTLSDIGNLDDDSGEIDADTPIIRLVSQIILDAYKIGASDIHLEPMESKFRIRYRIDGVCQEQPSPPRRLYAPIISRLKIMAKMKIDERRIPQDGRIQTEVPGGKSIDLRVNCLPTSHGESIVMRILDKEGLKLGLAELGFFADDQQTFEHLISLPDGILLVTGPTGSGKTTTLYSCLNFINKPDRKIITVEDPVEYQLAGINQVQVNNDIGFTFSQALRAMLRQAPNIIMLGEIRDLETASIAMQASITGHLVFSTLHTNDAPSAVTRLVDMGIKPFLVASAARGLMAQRLVRKVCKNCGEKTIPPKEDLELLGIDLDELENQNFMQGKGCSTCNKTGYKGRFGIFEVFVLNDDSRRLIFKNATANELRAHARAIGMRTLREDGIRKAIAGATTTKAVIRATATDMH